MACTHTVLRISIADSVGLTIVANRLVMRAFKELELHDVKNLAEALTFEDVMEVPCSSAVTLISWSPESLLTEKEIVIKYVVILIT